MGKIRIPSGRPPTDSKSLVQNFKYPFSFANKRIYEGGWSREVTVRELPVSKTLAGCQHETYCGWIPRAALAHGRRVGHHALRLQRGLLRSIRTGKVSSPTSTKMIFGFFPPESLIPFKASIPTDASSCSFLTTVIFRSQKRSC